MMDTTAVHILVFISGVVAIPNATITPSSPAQILVNAQKQFTCDITVQTNWRTVEYFDSTRGTKNVVIFYNGTVDCSHLAESPSEYDVSCGQMLGQFHLTIKSVTEKYHNQTVICRAQYGIGSASDIFVNDSTTIIVIIPLENIYISPDTSIIVVKQGEIRRFTCNATSRPLTNITWKTARNGQIIEDITSTEVQVDGTIVTSYLNYAGNKVDDGADILCIGQYNDTEKRSKSIRLQIIYAPDTKPRIQQIPYGNLTTGASVILTCTVSGGNPLPVLSWNCSGEETNNTAGNESSYSVAFTVNPSYNKRICSCYVSNHPIDSYRPFVQHMLVVLYPPVDNPSIQTIPTSHIFDGNNVTLICKVSGGNPIATLAWDCSGTSFNNSTESTASYSVTFTVNKTYNNKICTCSATHFGSSYTRSVQHTLVVYYAPDTNPSIQEIPDQNLTVGENVTLTCIVLGGNPLATLSWNCTGNKMNKTSGSTASSSVAFTVKKTYNNMVCTCLATHPVESYKKSAQHVLVVYFGPGTPVIKPTPNMPWFESNRTNLFCDYEEGNPKASIRWTIGNKNVDAKNDNQIYEFHRLTREENAMQITCTVYNLYSERLSSTKNLDVQYVPDIMVEKTYILTNESKSISLSCHASGNPEPLVKWTISGKPINSPTFNKSILYIDNINRTDSGNYTCEANSNSTTYGTLVSKEDTRVVVYFAPYVTVTKNVSNITENTDLILSCNAVGKPPNYAYGWKHTFAGDVIRVFKSNTKTLLLKQLSYQDIGKYECFVNNGIKDRHGRLNQTNNTIVEVQFKPAFLFYDKVTTGKENGNVSVSVDFISFPDIDTTVKWRNSTANSIIANSSNTFTTLERKSLYTKIYNTSVSFDKYGFKSSLHFPSFDKNQDGLYNLEVGNIIGVNNLTMRLVFSDRPESPKSFSASVIGSTVVTLTWEEGFNGGNTQTFIITYWETNSFHKKSINVSEHSDTKYEAEISDLKPSTLYFFHIIANNEEGNSDSANNTLDVLTKDISETTSSVIGPVAGAVGGIAAAGLFVVGIVIFMRKSLASRKKIDRKNLTFASPEEEDEDGLKVNELYVSAGENFTENSTSTGDVYAVINKTNDKKAKKTKIQETGLYAEVRSNKDEAKTEVVSANARKKQTRKPFTKEQLKEEKGRYDDVYENMAEHNTQHAPKNRNKDGLVYADLVFKGDGQRKFIIRGIENKTDYADIDLELKADPLPSDESDNEMDKVKERVDLNEEK